MTCTDLREMIDSMPFETLTRAERGAVVLHINTCQDCCQWTDSAADASRPLTKAERKRVELMADRDIQDGEFMELMHTAFGGR